MKFGIKVRTTLRWMLTILTVALVVVWIGSWWYGGYIMPFWSAFGKETVLRFMFGGGTFMGDVDIRDLTPQTTTGINWEFRRKNPQVFHLWDWEKDAAGSWIWIMFPLWVLPLLFAIPTILLWRNQIIARRRKPEVCAKCGYDRSGLDASSICPECGTGLAIKSATTSA